MLKKGPLDVFLMLVFCSGISQSYSNQRDKILPKLTKLAINSRRFDGRALESPAPIANQVRYICLKKSYNDYHFSHFIHRYISICSYFMDVEKLPAESVDGNVEKNNDMQLHCILARNFREGEHVYIKFQWELYVCIFFGLEKTLHCYSR